MSMDTCGKLLRSGLASRIAVRELRARLAEVTTNDPVIYEWWFRRDGAATLLSAIGEDVNNEQIEHDIIEGCDCLALYVGKGKSCRQRFDWHIRQHHYARTVQLGFLSTLRQTLSALLGMNAVDSEEAVNAFIDQYCYLDWTCFPAISPAELGRLEETRITAGYFPLNIQSNKNISPMTRKVLRRKRTMAKNGQFPKAGIVLNSK